jgi:hypothetical protein
VYFAIHSHQARKGTEDPLPPPSTATLLSYENMGVGTPECIIERAICADNDLHAEQLSAAFMGDREGYANARASSAACSSASSSSSEDLDSDEEGQYELQD